MNDALYRPLGEIAARAQDPIWESYFATGKLTPRTPRHISVRGTTAVIPLQGLIMRGAGNAGTDPDLFRRAVGMAASNRKIQSILVDVDSPGGEVRGVELAAQALYEARQSKPVVALTNDLNASAAIWISSNATHLYSTRDGRTGSHGVVIRHVNYGKMAERMGMEFTHVTAGKYKIEGNMLESLSEETRAYLQEQVNEVYDEFTAALARGRDKSTEHVLKHFGQGRVLNAKAAAEAGLIDGIVEADQILGKLQQRSGLIGVNAALTQEFLCEISGDSAENPPSSREAYYKKRLKLRSNQIAMS